MGIRKILFASCFYIQCTKATCDPGKFSGYGIKKIQKMCSEGANANVDALVHNITTFLMKTLQEIFSKYNGYAFGLAHNPKSLEIVVQPRHYRDDSGNFPLWICHISLRSLSENGSLNGIVELQFVRLGITCHMYTI